MAAKKSSKAPKRKARASDREYAAELVRRYREKDPYRMYTRDGAVFVEQFVDGDYLASVLQDFANNGTWDENPIRRDLRRRNMRLIFREHVRLLRAGRPMWRVDRLPESDLQAIEDVAQHFGVSHDTVKDAVYPRKTKTRKT